MTKLALGVTVFRRVEKIKQLLNSIDDQPISKVYIADQGDKQEEKSKIYKKEYPFELEIFDLDFNIGTGYCRWKVAKESTEDYLLIADSDNRIPANVELLVDLLEKKTNMGGICGVLAEKNHIWCASHDLNEKNNVLIRGNDTQKETQIVAGVPLIEFDVLPNITVFDRDCLDDYSWDKQFPAQQHLDFYVGHMKRTDWKFGVCPQVLFEHYPGGGAEYMDFRKDVTRLWKGKQMFLNKWGYEQIVLGETTWIHSHSCPPTKKSIIEDFGKNIIRDLPVSLQAKIVDVRDRARMRQGKGPV